MTGTLRDRAGLRLNAMRRKFLQRSISLARALDLKTEAMFPAWIGLMALAALVKIATAPTGPASVTEGLAMAFPFLLAGAAPVVGYRLAAGAFPHGRISTQPAIRLARYGEWRAASSNEVRQALVSGPAGFMVSLIVGILLNVPVRTVEYLAVLPAINPADPRWAQLLSLMMTLDVVVMNLIYAVCFVMALRSFPLFPRLLVLAWGLDVALQLGMARVVAASGDLPADVAQAMGGFLLGNIKKVCASVMIWLPYLILSSRVNLQFRHRVRVDVT